MARQESPNAVEPWVVRAISEGVIDGRIDQLNRKAKGPGVGASIITNITVPDSSFRYNIT